MAAKDELGRRGERLAVDHLVASGYEIVERNWRCALGEVDVVARDGPYLVFVEVKTRSGLGFGHPLEAITSEKLSRLRRLAGEWMSAHPDVRGRPRIDAIAVIAPRGGLVEIDHRVSI